ncbi:MAG: hypothetical protein JSS49_25920 [Planctomycetes bacterium]|nr:hypothetical protein [Planctomycetota bacterium]
MKPSQFAGLFGCVALFLLAALIPLPASACPFCSAPSLTLTEQLSGSDSAVLVKWIGGTPAKLSDAGSTEFEVIEVVHQQNGGKLQKGSKINLIRYRSGKAGDLFLLMGTLGAGNIEWGSPFEVTQAGYDYMKNSPKPDQPAIKRLGYFLKYLEHSDKMIGDDAFGEFANAAYSDVVQLAKELPRDKLRTWLTSNTVAPGRVGLYGMMLGLCGNDEDAKLMEHKILETTEEFRLGIDGVMGGYLLLTGDKGLSVLDEKKLKDKQVPFSETYAAMQAIRFMWQYGNNRIDQERLRQSMRILLERPELTDLVIADLARMKDWSVQTRLMDLYEAEAFNIPSIKRAIVRFTLASIKDTGIKKDDVPAGDGSSEAPAIDLPAHCVLAQKCLDDLEKRDPKTVHEAKRFFLLK